jgi:rubrerythrin
VELLAHLSKEAGLRTFAELSEKEILALAISLEEEHGRIYDEYAHALADNFPASAKVFKEMAAEEDEHRRWLIDLYRQKFGDHIPLIRSQDVKGFVKHQPIWLVRPLGLDKVRAQAEAIEYETRRFYEKALERASDASVRKLLGDLAAAERNHISLAQQLGEAHLTVDARAQEADAQRRMFVLQVVQPGLAGLMDGSVSTLAPLFAAAFATHNTWETFLVGMAASVGAGISMGFAEALSDDGSMTGRGRPWIRGVITGLMTTLGGVGHTLPYLIADFGSATALAIAVVLVELWAIAWIRARYMDTRFLQAAFEVVIGGLIVFAAGILIGSA